MLARKEEDRDETELTDAVRPLIEEAEKILNETAGAIKGADPGNKLTNQAKRAQLDHKATPEEQRLAEALKVVSTRQPHSMTRGLYNIASSSKKVKGPSNGRKISWRHSRRRRKISGRYLTLLANRLLRLSAVWASFWQAFLTS